MNLSAGHRRALLNLACEEVRRHLGGAGTHLAERLRDDATLQQPAGSFVSLHHRQTHALRGCVGRIDASGPMLQAVCHAAGQCLKDPRFADHPVTLAELPQLELELSLLGPLRPASHPMDFDPLNDGIYLTIGPKAGCFLPQVGRETGWTREQLLDRLCTEKLGLPANAWRDPAALLQIFPTIILGPQGFLAAFGGTIRI
jgi:AmmeMemoRadiSam system protein A